MKQWCPLYVFLYSYHDATLSSLLIGTGDCSYNEYRFPVYISCRPAARDF